jgi:hypothetical protein
MFKFCFTRSHAMSAKALQSLAFVLLSALAIYVAFGAGS